VTTSNSRLKSEGWKPCFIKNERIRYSLPSLRNKSETQIKFSEGLGGTRIGFREKKQMS